MSFMATHQVSQATATLKLLKNSKGKKKNYKCKPIERKLTQQLKPFKIDGKKTIFQLPALAQKKEHEKCELPN
jgi:hypothetical protein